MIRRSRKSRWLLPATLLSVSALVASGCSPDEDTETPGGGAAGASGDTVKLGILGECEGPFGGFHEDTVAGVTLAMVNHAGATVNSETTALEGWEGAEVNGTSIELVGIGCGDDTPDTI